MRWTWRRGPLRRSRTRRRSPPGTIRRRYRLTWPSQPLHPVIPRCIIWYDRSARRTSTPAARDLRIPPPSLRSEPDHAWTTATNLVMGQGPARPASARKTKRGMNALRHAGTAFLLGLAILLVRAGLGPARSEESAPAPTVPAASPAPAPAQADCKRTAFRVVIDVGHTLDVPGAMSARGVTEYAFNLQLSQAINQALLDAGFDKTVLMITPKTP